MLMGCFNGLDNFIVGHAPLQNLTADAFAAAFHTEFNDAAAGVRQAASSIFVEEPHMGIDDKGQGTDFLVGRTELFNIGAIKGK